eukprot:6554325-Pyramimonas_sp.AAC.1
MYYRRLVAWHQSDTEAPHRKTVFCFVLAPCMRRGVLACRARGVTPPAIARAKAGHATLFH